MRLTRAQREAVELFLLGPGCVRVPSSDRFDEGHTVYKKGWEVRFAVGSRTAATGARRVLTRAGLRPGRPYSKSPRRWIVPLYGREAVHRFLDWVDAVE